MKKILFVYPSMGIGGSTTSLLSLLNEIDYNKYEVDLQLYENKGVYLDQIPDKVHLLPQARVFSQKKWVGLLQRGFYPIYWYYGFLAQIMSKKYKNPQVGSQLTSYARAKTARGNNKEYDVAVGFLELWSNSYVYSKIKAKRKIAWFHLDYQKSGLMPSVDKKVFEKFTQIVLVSEECLKSFFQVFPEYEEKAVYIENILSRKVVAERAEEITKDFYKGKGIDIITVCRIDFRHKGLDRAAEVFKRLKNDGYVFKWHIVGEGQDFEKIKEKIRESGMENDIVLYGAKANPHPYVKQCDLFLLPSVFEGKPMAVTEAQMLGIPTAVTHYSSAPEQVTDKVNGLIMENCEEGIYEGLKYILDNPDVLKTWKKNIECETWSYKNVLKQLDELFLEEDVNY